MDELILNNVIDSLRILYSCHENFYIKHYLDEAIFSITMAREQICQKNRDLNQKRILKNFTYIAHFNRHNEQN